MRKISIAIKKNEAKILKKEIKDMFDIYLENDIAGDNHDRRSKLNAVRYITSIF